MEKRNKKDSHIANTSSSHNKVLTKTYKPVKVQYFTFGKDNSLVHHPTTLSKKSSPNAIFCQTNPFRTQLQENKTCHKKTKSILQAPNKQEKFTSHADAIKKDAISKITRNLRQPPTSSVSNSDSISIVVRGTSLKLEPKKHFEVSTCCASGYCPSIKRCKMCGEIMLNIQSSTSSFTKPCSSRDSCSGCLNKKTSIIIGKEKVTNLSHQHNPIIKRCIICSKLFKQPSGLVVCEKCPTVVRTQEAGKGPVPTTTDTFLSSKTNSEKTAKNIMSSRLREDYMDKFVKYKASQSTKCDKLPLKSKDTIEDLLTVKGLSSKQHKTKAIVSDKTVSTEKSSKPMHTKLSAESNQLTTKAKNTTQKPSSKGYLYSGQCKNTKVANGRIKAANMPTYTKPFKSNLAVKCKSVPQERTSGIYLGMERRTHTNTANKVPSTEHTNVSTQTKSLPESRQLITSKNDPNELPSKSFPASKQPKTTNVDNETAVADKVSQFIQADSLSETTSSDFSSESFTSAGNLKRGQAKNSNMDQRGVYTGETNPVVQTSSLPETSPTTSKSAAESYYKKQSKNIYQTSKEDSSETPIHTKSSQLDQDFLFKISTDLVLRHNKNKNGKDEGTLPSPVVQNITLNNYYYLTGCDLKEKFPNLPVSCTNHSLSTAKYSSESTLISSEIEDSLEIDKIQGKQNMSNFDNQTCHAHSKSSSLQLEFPKSVSEELGGAFKHNADDIFNNIYGSQLDKISFLKDAHSALENDPCPTIGRVCDMASKLHHIGRQEKSFQNLGLCVEKEFQNYNTNAQSLCGVKTINPYTQKSLMIFEEMDNIRNEQIDPEKILKELKQNPQLMKAINQMAAKKLNFSRKATVFKDLGFK